MFFTMLGAMGFVLLMWAVLGMAFVGIGQRMWQAAGLRDPSRAATGDEFFNAFWLGFSGVLCFLQFWNFWLPINHAAWAIVVVGGLLMFDRSWVAERGKGILQNPRLTERPRTLLAFVLVAVWLSNRVLGPGNAHDSGLYHYDAIRWANEYPVVPGLGNLNAAFALNNASFLYDAMLNAGPWAGHGNHLANGLLLLACFARILPSLQRLVARGTRCRPEHVFDVVLLPAAVMLALGKDLPSPKTDLPPGLLSLVFARTLLVFCGGVVNEKIPERKAVRTVRPAGWLFIFSAYAATLIILKLSAATLAVGFWGLGVWAWMRRAGHRPSLAGKIVAIASLAGVLWVGPWIARNIVLSGYPLYPAKVAAVPVDWRVPEPAVDFLQHAIRAQPKGNLTLWLYGKLAETKLAWYARVMKPPFETVEQIRGLNWLGPWLLTLPVSGPIEILLPGLIAVCAGFAMWRSGRRSARSDVGWRGMVAVPIAALIFWLWAGPDPRYGWAAAWCLAALMVAWACERGSGLGLRRLAVVSILLTIPTFAFRVAVLAVQAEHSPWRQVPFQWPGSDHGFHPTPAVALKTVVNSNGVKLYVPVDPDETLTWGGPLPCTGAWPPITSNLSLRREGDLRGGFRVKRSPFQD